MIFEYELLKKYCRIGEYLKLTQTDGDAPDHHIDALSIFPRNTKGDQNVVDEKEGCVRNSDSIAHQIRDYKSFAALKKEKKI